MNTGESMKTRVWSKFGVCKRKELGLKRVVDWNSYKFNIVDFKWYIEAVATVAER